MSDFAAFVEAVQRHDQISDTTALSERLEENRDLRTIGRELRKVSVWSADYRNYSGGEGEDAPEVFAQGQLDEDGDWVEAQDDDDGTMRRSWQVALTNEPGGCKANDVIRPRPLLFEASPAKLQVMVGEGITVHVSYPNKHCDLPDEPPNDESHAHYHYDQEQQKAQVIFADDYKDDDDDDDDEDVDDTNKTWVRLVASLTPVTTEQHAKMLRGDMSSLVGNTTIALTFVRLEFSLEEHGWNADRFRHALVRPSTLLLDLSAPVTARPTLATASAQSEQSQKLPSKRKRGDESEVVVPADDATLQLAKQVAQKTLSKTLVDLDEENKRLRMLLEEMRAVSIIDSETNAVYSQAQLDSGDDNGPNWAPQSTSLSVWRLELNSLRPCNVDTTHLLSLHFGEFLVLSLAPACTRLRIIGGYGEDDQKTLVRLAWSDTNANLLILGEIGPITKDEYDAAYSRTGGAIDDVFEGIGNGARVEFFRIYIRRNAKDGWTVRSFGDDE